MPTITPTNKITIIEPTIKWGSKEPLNSARKKKVAAYARVSTENDEQQNSYAAQMDYYTTFIKANPEWKFAGIYSDEGISGTNTKNREGFKQMIRDAKAGMIDIILTKSISRFSRNTLDAISTVRELQALGIEVRFEKENIRTLDPKCEVMLTILSSLAQEESRSISTNVTWGKKKAMMDGKVEMPYHSFLGYKKGADGRPEIVPEEAEIIKRIYRRYLEGATINIIAEELMKDGIKSPMGKDSWSVATIRSILSNEKYKGDALLQKSITVDFLAKKRKKNEGEATQYYVRDSHQAIIERDIFDYTQYELKRRNKIKNRIYSKSGLNTKVVCGQCGNYYGHKTCHNSKYVYEFWGCNTRQKSCHKCDAPNIRQSDLYAAFGEAITKARQEGRMLDEETDQMIRARLEDNLMKAREAAEQIAVELAKFTENNTKRMRDPEAYINEKDKLNERLVMRNQAVEDAESAIILHTAQKVKRWIFAETVKDLPDNPPYDDLLFTKTVEQVIVEGEDNGYRLTFLFVNGAKVVIHGSKTRKHNQDTGRKVKEA